MKLTLKNYQATTAVAPANWAGDWPDNSGLFIIGATHDVGAAKKKSGQQVINFAVKGEVKKTNHVLLTETLKAMFLESNIIPSEVSTDGTAIFDFGNKSLYAVVGRNKLILKNMATENTPAPETEEEKAEKAAKKAAKAAAAQ